MRFLPTVLLLLAALLSLQFVGEDLALQLLGKEAIGTVFHSSRAYAGRRNSFRAAYEFEAEGHGRVTGSFHSLRAGAGWRVEILYLPRRPGLNGPRSLGYALARTGVFGAGGLLLCMAAVSRWPGAVVEQGKRRQRRRWLRCLPKGALVAALLTAGFAAYLVVVPSAPDVAPVEAPAVDAQLSP